MQEDEDLIEDEVSNEEDLEKEQPLSKGNPITNLIKNPLGSIANKLSGLFGKKKKQKKSLIKSVLEKIPFKVKIFIGLAIIFILIAVIIIMLIGDLATKETITTRNNAVKSLAIDENSSEASKLALELFQNYDSLIGFTTDQLQQIYQTFLDNNSNENNYILTSGKKEFGKEDGSKFTINAKRSLYQHIQRTEKYNFNKIKWKEYTHTQDGIDIETEENDELELIFPKGIDEDTKATLLKTTAPYLLTQDIPFGLLCGMVGYSGNRTSNDITIAEKFTYQVIKESLTKITLNKYDLETIKYKTSYDDVNYNRYTYSYTVNTYSNGYQELVSETAPELQETTHEITPEAKIDGTTQYLHDIYWYVAEAKTYDASIVNNFNYTKYNNSDVEQIKNPDSNTLVNTIEINELANDILPKQVNSNGGRPTDKNGNPEAPTSTETKKAEYIKKEGNTYVYEKEWKDKLSPMSTDYQPLNYNTAKEFNTKSDDTYSNYETDKTIVDESKFVEKNPSGTSIFDKYTKEDKNVKLFGMSILDIIDSNSGIYKKYLSGSSNISEYEGIGRNKLKLAYTEVKNMLNSLIKKIGSDDKSNQDVAFNSYTTGIASEEALPFVYGTSLGYQVTTLSFSSSSTTGHASGLDLLRMFIHSFEGDGSSSGGGMFDENYNHVTDETKAKYYKVYDAKDGVFTVGYGVNINANFDKVKEALAEVGTTINSISDISYGMYLDKSAIDKVEDIALQNKLDIVVNETQGLDLTEYQIHALASRAYVHGTTAVSSGSSAQPFRGFYEKYWHQDTDDQYESLYEQYKDKQTATQEIVSKVNFSHQLFTECLDIYVSQSFDSQYPGYETRQRAEFTLFSTGYYSPLQLFYRKGGASPGNVQLLDGSGNVDITACLDLQIWFEENIFGNNIHAGTSISPGPGTHSLNLDPSIPRGSYYSAKTLEYAKKVGGGQHFEYKGVESGYKAVGENNLGIFQCTWWAQSRGTQYLADNGWSGSYIGDRGALGDGRLVASKISEQYGVPLNTNINNIKANSIASFSGGANGHVVYIEAVGNDYYVISHCGSGHTWYGVDIIPKGSNVFYPFAGSVCLDDML